MLTYKQAYDKIIEAYFRNEIEPLSPEFCFCGTLCNNNSDWFRFDLFPSRKPIIHIDSENYTGLELGLMEYALLNTLRYGYKYYEDALFSGMCAALDVLKEIHRSRGEDVDDSLQLTKRELQTC